VWFKLAEVLESGDGSSKRLNLAEMVGLACWVKFRAIFKKPSVGLGRLNKAERGPGDRYGCHSK
jgi:hypothetical protein